jgi:hypothetical protein
MGTDQLVGSDDNPDVRAIAGQVSALHRGENGIPEDVAEITRRRGRPLLLKACS